ncbi:MAG: phage minor head protein [Wolinella sp.]
MLSILLRFPHLIAAIVINQRLTVAKDGIIPELKKGGWFGEVRAVDTRSGEIKDIYVGSRRLKNIYETNMRTTYARARYERQMESSLEYFRYVSVLDSATRPKHRQWHGLILPKDDPFWDKNYPPNDWGCRCSVNAYSKEQITAKGWKVSKTPSADIASSDFSYSPSRDTQKLRGLIDERLKELQKRGTSERILKALENELAFLERSVWEKSLKHAVEELLVKKNIKSPIEVFQVGKIGELLKQEIEKAGGITLEEAGIVMDKHAMLHIREERKGAYGQALRIEEILKIPEVLQRAESVSYDKENKNIIYWFKDERNKEKVNKVVVYPNHKVKKFGVINYAVTVGKIDKVMREKARGYIKIL